MEFTTHLELHSQTTRLVEGVSHGRGHRSHTGFSPSTTSCSKELRPGPRPKRPLQITTRAPGGPDFKFELLPLHSPLLRQSLLVSFPPLIDMLKFSGYPCLIRGQSVGWGVGSGAAAAALGANGIRYAQGRRRSPPLGFEDVPRDDASTPSRGSEGDITLGQACPPEYRGAQCAFKNSMTH